jgi:hypothetical protein
MALALASVAQTAVIDQIRLTPDDIGAKESGGAGAGTSGVVGIKATVLLGDPTKPGLYTIRLSIPANTKIQAHTHGDNRSAIVDRIEDWIQLILSTEGIAALKCADRAL